MCCFLSCQSVLRVGSGVSARYAVGALQISILKVEKRDIEITNFEPSIMQN